MSRWLPVLVVLPLALQAACSRCTSSIPLRAVPDDPEKVVAAAAQPGVDPAVAKTAAAGLPLKGQNPRTLPAFSYVTYESFELPNPNVVENARAMLGELKMQGIQTLGHPMVFIESIPKRDDPVRVLVGLPVPDGVKVAAPLVLKQVPEQKVWASEGAAAQASWDLAERSIAEARRTGLEPRPPLMGRYSDDDWTTVSPQDEGIMVLVPVQ